MVAMPTEQYAVPRMLRKSVRQPNVNKKALKALYQKLAVASGLVFFLV